MKQLLRKNFALLLALALVLGLFPNSISAEEDSNPNNNENAISSEINLDPIVDRDLVDDFKENSDVPDIYGTTPETTYTFEVNGETIQPGESIYIYSSPDMQQPLISTEANLTGVSATSEVSPAAVGVNSIGIQPVLNPQGGTSKITAGLGVTKVVGSKPVLVGVNYVLKKAMTKGGTPQVISRTSDNITFPGLGSSTQKNIALSGVGYYSVTFEVSVHYPKEIVPLVSSSSTLLLSKTARPWPGDYVDPVSGKRITDPTSLTWTKASSPVKWTDTERKAFRSWYQTTYNVPNYNWSDVEIHHIQPREFGGSNSNSNLIPIKKSIHKLYSAFFAGYK
ncbi:HNH endonuclease signature motif containing protein [Paenibacillus silvae]|uniref:HNH endonuclease signature motif containing protein n=1 Tax=Paenibacillus silvae TaxID=1325358 RepID=UPI0025A2BF5E|nr:HNH endonuclease signature motif containing protein [Paenibacillus silvae]MDM5277178.1 HNH endonuclease signature motif containing protein [Paenibacillus silvae]